MDEQKALRGMARKNEAALEWVIERYGAYVSTVIHNIIGSAMSPADIEEAAADVFLALWENVARVNPGKLKAYLGALARNKALKKTRELGLELPLEEDLLIISPQDVEGDIAAAEEARLVRQAVLAMTWPDREIFLRHYYYCQSVAVIASELDMPQGTVKTRLRRGREKLKETLIKGGWELG